MKKMGDEEGEDDAGAGQVAGATTRRHKHTPSVGSAVGTIQEGEEDESESPLKEKGGPLAQISNAAEKKEDVAANEAAAQEVSQPTGATPEESKKDEGGEEAGEGADDGDDAASVVTAIHDGTEKDAETEE